MGLSFQEFVYCNKRRRFENWCTFKCDVCDEQKLKHAISTCESQIACWKSTCGDVTAEPKTEVMMTSRRFVRDYEIMRDLLEKEIRSLY